MNAAEIASVPERRCAADAREQGLILAGSGRAARPSLPRSWEFPKYLADQYALAEYIAAHSPYDVDEDLIEENYRGRHAVLCEIPISELRAGNPDHNIRSASKERRYARRRLDTMPPLVIEHREIWMETIAIGCARRAEPKPRGATISAKATHQRSNYEPE